MMDLSLQMMDFSFKMMNLELKLDDFCIKGAFPDGAKHWLGVDPSMPKRPFPLSLYNGNSVDSLLKYVDSLLKCSIFYSKWSTS